MGVNLTTGKDMTIVQVGYDSTVRVITPLGECVITCAPNKGVKPGETVTNFKVVADGAMYTRINKKESEDGYVTIEFQRDYIETK